MSYWEVVNHVPVFGHFKGATYLICGEEKRGLEILKAANRSTLVYGGGALAGAATGGLAAPAAGVLMGICYDVADTGFSGRPQGIVRNLNRAIDKPSARRILDTAFIPIEDAIGGYTGGKSARAAMSRQLRTFSI